MKKFLLLATLLTTCLLNSQVAAFYMEDAPNYYDSHSLGDSRFRVGADYLYWKVEQENLNSGELTTIDGINSKAKSLHPHFNYTSGFKVNAGYDLPGNEWSLDVEYSHLYANAHVSATTQPNQTILPNNPNSAVAFLTQVNTQWNLDFNQVDVDLSKNYTIGPSFKLSPHIGFRNLWWHQAMALKGDGALKNAGHSTVNLNQKFKEKLNGYGIEGGLYTDWKILSSLSIIGHVGGSVLYSTFKVTKKVSTTNTVTQGLLNKTTFTHRIHTGIPTVDYFIGLHYQNSLWDIVFATHLGWEQRVIINANHYSDNKGNLSTAGLTGGIEFIF